MRFCSWSPRSRGRSAPSTGWVVLPASTSALSAAMAGRNPKDAKLLLARELVTRFHSTALAQLAEADFDNRARGGIPDELPELSLGGAPLAIGNLLKQAGLVPSTSEALRLIDQGGVRIDGVVVSDKALKVAAGTRVLQVGKRKFARVTLSA